ncbi:MAG: DUF1731 domain-containing protein [Anaerolineae bacterium]
MSKRIVILGATGLIGRHLCNYLYHHGYRLVVLDPDPQAAREQVPAADYVQWEPGDPTAAWYDYFDGAHGVINLPQDCFPTWRITPASLKAMLMERVVSTYALSHAIALSDIDRPRVFLTGSSVSIYGYHNIDDQPITEETPPGDGIWGQTVRLWEEAASEVEALGVRTAALRLGYVLDSQRGVLPWHVRRVAGGLMMQTADEWRPWIHVKDVVRLIAFALEEESLRGPLNLTAPRPVRSQEFMQTMAEVTGAAFHVSLPYYPLRAMLGRGTDLITRGRRVLPVKAQRAGFRYQYPTLRVALRDLFAEQNIVPALVRTRASSTV